MSEFIFKKIFAFVSAVYAFQFVVRTLSEIYQKGNQFTLS